MRLRSSIPFALLPLAAACSPESVAPPADAPINYASLADKPPRPDAGGGPTPKERALPEAYAAALTSPKMEKLGPLLDDFALATICDRDSFRGRDKVVHAYDRFFGAYDDRKVGLTQVWRTDKVQAFTWTKTGVQAREWMGIAPTQKPVAYRGITLLWSSDEGTIKEAHVYFDEALIKSQLGAAPKELAKITLAPLPTLPTEPPKVYDQTGSPDEAKNVKTVRGTLDALEENKEAAYLAPMADDVEIHSLEHAEPLRGKDGARAYFRAMRKAIGQLDTTVQTALGVGSFVVVEYQIAGEQTGALDWIPFQADRGVRFTVVDVVEMRDGKIARVARYDNPSVLIAPPEKPDREKPEKTVAR